MRFLLSMSTVWRATTIVFALGAFAGFIVARGF